MLKYTKKIFKKFIPNYLVMIVRAFFYPNTIIAFKSTFNFDGLCSQHVVSFMEEKNFLNALKKGKLYTENREDYFRLYLGCELAKYATKLDGDFVECGVWLGTMSKCIITYTNFNSLTKNFFLIDTFEGIPEKNLMEKDNRYNDKYNKLGVLEISSDNLNKKVDYQDNNILNLVKEKFKDDKVKIIKGIVPDDLKKINSNKFSFIHIDMNNAFPEVESIKYFWDKLVIGGVVLLDDYAYSDYYSLQKESIDALGKVLNFSVITLPSGQGLILKN